MTKLSTLFVDLHHACGLLASQTVADRVEELARALSSAALCAVGGFPLKQVGETWSWCGAESVDADHFKRHFTEALGLSAVLTYANKKGHSLNALGRICVDRDEQWAYHWTTISIVLAGHSRAVHLAFARDTRFQLGWAVEKEYTGRLLGVFVANASVHAWLKFTSKKDDLSFDAPTRAAMGQCAELLQRVLP